MKKALGFTLSEILITIGIIGIIATITIPPLINNYRKQMTVKKLKKTYSTLTQAIKMSEAENGSISGWERNTKLEFWQTYIFPYLKVVDIKEFGQIKPKISYTRANGTKETMFTPFSSKSIVATLLDGSILILGTESDISKGTSLTFGIDINGTQKPNIIGIDFFMFAMLFDNDNDKYPKLVPYGAYKTSDYPFGEMTRENIINTKGSIYSYACSKQGRGQFCSALIMLDNWQIAKDYPWR